MNKDRCQGFVAGALASVLILGLGGAALAAGRTIEVEDGIAVTINGVPFTPRDVNGERVPLFAYNGTTYAPVRAFSKAAGLTVDYDAANRTARIETAEYAAAADPDSANYITEEKAKELALADAGVKSAEAFFLRHCLDWEDGRAVYEVEFCAGSAEYDYELDACTGRVLEKDYECENYDWSRRDYYHNNHHGSGHHSGHHGAAVQSGKDLITAEAAKAKALERLPGGTVVKCELDYEDDWGRWEYELELWKDGVEYDCEVNAATGEILKWERD